MTLQWDIDMNNAEPQIINEELPVAPQMTEEELYAEECRCKDMLASLGIKLSNLASEQELKRNDIEDRMLEDYTNYQGEYAQPPSGNGSKLFVNLTRNKSTAGEARFSDMVFPTDDMNWGIKETPVPILTRDLEEPKPVVDKSGQPMNKSDGEQITTGDIAKKIVKKASQAAALMQTEISDQLTEAEYNSVARDTIHDAVTLGTGIIKGPILTGTVKQAWLKDPATGEFALVVKEEILPTTERVDPWNFFPDMSARNMKEAEFVFERQYLTKKDLRKIAMLPDVLLDNLKLIMGTKPGEGPEDEYLNDLRNVTNADTAAGKNRYKMWIYSGPVSKADLTVAGAPEAETLETDEVTAVVWLIGTTIIKAFINPLDTEDLPYSVFNWEKDDACIFGFGIPYLMRGPQKIINGAWRMMMDNSGLSTGPQIVVDRDLIEPADGDWSLSARKTWWKKRKAAPINNAFATFDINSHQAELAAIYQMARQLADEETSLPLIAQGETAGHITDTAAGMRMLMNSANIVLRKAVKNWDDDITVPLIKRFYDWNMQYNEKQDIKGDFTINARGSSHLLVKETQANNAVHLLNLAISPPLAPITKIEDAYRKVVTSMQHDPDDWIKSKDELEQNKNKEPSIEMQVAAKEFELKQNDQKIRAQEASAKQQHDAAKLKQDGELKVLEIQSDRELAMAKLTADERKTAQSGQFKTNIDMVREQNKTRELDLKEQANRISEIVSLKDIEQRDRELLYKARTGKPGQ